MRGAKQKEMFEISDLRRREILHLRSVCQFVTKGGGGGGGGKGGVLCFFHHRYARAIFFWGGSKFCISIFLGGFSEEDFVDIFLGSSQNWTQYI